MDVGPPLLQFADTGRSIASSRHLVIHRDQIRPQLGCNLQRMRHARRLSNHFEGTLGFKKRSDQNAYGLVVVNYQNPGWHLSSLWPEGINHVLSLVILA